MPPLTQRQKAVLELLADGLTMAEISRTLFISQNTVRTHAHAIYRKFGVSGVSSRAQAIKIGRAEGLISLKRSSVGVTIVPVKCDDEGCICCYPENMHSCPGPPEGQVGDQYVCPECEAVWTCHIGRPEHWPSNVTWRHQGLWWGADRPIPTVPELRRRGMI